MKSIFRYLILIFSVMIPSLCLTGCVYDYMPECPGEPVQDVATQWLSLRLSLSADETRTDGDATSAPNDEAPEGRLPGTAAENAIDDLTLFFLSADKQNDAGSKFERVLYIDLVNYSGNFTITNGDNWEEIKINLGEKTVVPNEQYYIITVANMGNLSSITTLDDLRQHLTTSAWTETADGKVNGTHFAMSSFDNNGDIWSPIKNDEYHIGTESHPYLGECSLMRLAGRIDLCCSATSDTGWGKFEKDNGEVVYNCQSGSGTSTGTVYVQSAELVNTMTAPSWTIRRLVDADNPVADKVTYGGLINKGTGGLTSYVADPNFFNKTGSTTADDLSSWYDNRPDAVKGSPSTHFSGKALVSNFIEGTLTNEKYEGKAFDKFLTIGYVNENTFKSELNANLYNFATGVVFKTVFVPATVYSSQEIKDENKATLTKGSDFWVWTTTTPSASDPTVLYFSSETAANAYANAHPGGSIVPHPSGISYYHIWIEHASEGEVMKYAIVRNNIYRILLKFTGPGYNRPYENKNPEDVEWRIFTRPWNIRWQPSIKL